MFIFSGHRDRGDKDRRGRRSSRSPPRRKRELSRDRPAKTLLDEPEINGIYDARVNNITNFGAFATLEGFRRKIEGLIHISQIKNERVSVVTDVLSRAQKVKVKVLQSFLKFLLVSHYGLSVAYLI